VDGARRVGRLPCFLTERRRRGLFYRAACSSIPRSIGQGLNLFGSSVPSSSSRPLAPASPSPSATLGPFRRRTAAAAPPRLVAIFRGLPVVMLASESGRMSSAISVPLPFLFPTPERSRLFGFEISDHHAGFFLAGRGLDSAAGVSRHWRFNFRRFDRYFRNCFYNWRRVVVTDTFE